MVNVGFLFAEKRCVLVMKNVCLLCRVMWYGERFVLSVKQKHKH